MSKSTKKLTAAIKAYLPENFSLASHISTYKPTDYRIHSFNMDQAYYLLSQISEVKAGDKRQLDDFDFVDNYTLLYSRSLQSVVQSYSVYLDYFIDTHVVETDDYYVSTSLNPDKKAKSYGYRFAPRYQYSDLVEVNYSAEFEKKLAKRQEKQYNRLHLFYSHLTKWLQSSHLVIDSGKAKEYIAIKRKAQLTNDTFLDVKKDRKSGEKIYKNPHEQYRSNQLNIQKIETGVLSCYVDETVHRMHTPLTNLKKELRNYIYFEKGGIKHKLVSIDIKTSQPYLFILLLNQNNSKSIKRLGLDVSYILINPMLKRLCDLYENEAFPFGEDVALYKSLVSNDGTNALDLYTYMFQECKRRGYSFKDREDVKTRMYGVLFGSLEYENDMKKVFAELFPTINEIFKLLKQRDKADLPCFLQSVESHFLLTKVTKAIAKKYPTAPLYTIHDSVTTTEEYIDRVHAVMEEELTKLVGLPPKLKREEWLPENVDLEKYANALQTA